MGLDVSVSGSTMGHQLIEEKYFKKHLYGKEEYANFTVDLRKSWGLVNLFSKVGQEFEEDCFYVKKEQLLKLMNDKLQKNPFDYEKEFYDTVDYFLLMHHLERNRHLIESKSKDEFVLVFELSY